MEPARGGGGAYARGAGCPGRAQPAVGTPGRCHSPAVSGLGCAGRGRGWWDVRVLLCLPRTRGLRLHLLRFRSVPGLFATSVVQAERENPAPMNSSSSSLLSLLEVLPEPGLVQLNLSHQLETPGEDLLPGDFRLTFKKNHPKPLRKTQKSPSKTPPRSPSHPSQTPQRADGSQIQVIAVEGRESSRTERAEKALDPHPPRPSPRRETKTPPALRISWGAGRAPGSS